MAQKNIYAKKLRQKKELERHVSQQMVADAAVIAANKVFGAGKKRCVEFMVELSGTLDEIHDMIYGDTADIEYSKSVIDRKLQEILKEYFEPWDKRYEP